MCRLIRIRLYPNKVERTEHVYEVRVRVYEMGVRECVSYSVGAFETVRTTSRMCVCVFLRILSAVLLSLLKKY